MPVREKDFEPAMTAKNITSPDGEFVEHFGRRPFRLSHNLTDHPLFTLDRLLQLSRDLPDAKVEWNAGSIDEVMAKGPGPSNGLDAQETIRRIAECGSWMVLKHIQFDAEYKQLLEDCLDDIRHQLQTLGHEPFQIQGFIFVSSPGAVTPYHLDPENNFLLQIRGSKVMSVHDRTNRHVASYPELESFAAGGHRNLNPNAAAGPKPSSYDLQPGDVLHVPFHAPHSVQNGDEVSVSFSVTFQTLTSDTEHGVLWINHWLRKIGLTPRPFDNRRTTDRFKFSLFRSLRGIKRLL